MLRRLPVVIALLVAFAAGAFAGSLSGARKRHAAAVGRAHAANDLRYLCQDNCGAIQNNDLRYFCQKNCGAIQSNRLRYFCQGNCGAI
jgi:hypothetical protein